MLRDKKLQRARAAKMLESKIMHGKTNKEIAADFGVSLKTTENALTLARKGDLVVTFEDKLMTELLPLAHTAMVGALTEGNAKMALEVLKGAGIIRPHTQNSRAQEASDHDLSAYIAKKRHAAQLAESTIDAEFTRTALLALPSHPDSSDAPDGPREGTGDALRVAGSGQIEPSGAPGNSETGCLDAETEARPRD